MRLIEVYKICKKESKQLEIYRIQIHEQISKTKSVDDVFKEFYEYMNDVFGNIPFFSEILYKMEQENNINEFYIEEMLDEITIKVEFIILLYETTINQNAESIGLDIKIPSTDNITELKKYIDALEFIFTKCPFFQCDEESLRLQAVDNGSIWLIFGVVGASVAVGSILLNNIAAFIDKCLVIRSHRLTCDMQEQMVRNAEIETKEKEKLLESINKLYEIQVKAAVKELETDTKHKICDGDERGRAEQSLKKMEKLIDQGLQIYSSINSPEEIKALFAPLEMHYLEIGKKLEQIEEKNKDTE